MAEIATTWSPRGNQEGEYDPSDNLTLVDASSITLVDSSGVSLVSGSSAFTPIPTTVWTDDPGL